MFGVSHWEILAVAAVALVLFGPSMLPRLAGSLGETVRELRKSVKDIKENIDE